MQSSNNVYARRPHLPNLFGLEGNRKNVPGFRPLSVNYLSQGPSPSKRLEASNFNSRNQAGRPLYLEIKLDVCAADMKSRLQLAKVF